MCVCGQSVNERPKHHSPQQVFPQMCFRTSHAFAEHTNERYQHLLKNPHTHTNTTKVGALSSISRKSCTKLTRPTFHTTIVVCVARKGDEVVKFISRFYCDGGVGAGCVGGEGRGSAVFHK